MASWGTKHYFSIIILLAVLLGACSEKEQLPEDILSQKRMTHLMIQIHLLEAKVGRMGVRRDSALVVFKHFENKLFEANGIDSTIYYKSFNYYGMHPEYFSEVYAAVSDSMLEIESKERLKIEAIAKKKLYDDSLLLAADSLQFDSAKIGSKPIPTPIKASKDSVQLIKKFQFNERIPE
ncbi:MAG: DUF4296 domain-containing protein [Cytophagales bacterium]|nr:DUF4296 domain-containing protein [Cytophagales bacterium]